MTLRPGDASPSDFSIPTTITVPAHQLSASINVTPIDDDLAEGTETLVVRLGDALVLPDDVADDADFVSEEFGQLVFIDTSEVEMEIADDDIPLFTVNTVELAEGQIGGVEDVADVPFTEFVFTVSHNGMLTDTVTVTPSLDALDFGPAGFGPDLAFDPDDGSGLGGNALVFTPTGTNSQSFTVRVFHDIVQEADEVFTVSFETDDGGLTITPVTETTGTILNDDEAILSVIQLPTELNEDDEEVTIPTPEGSNDNSLSEVNLGNGGFTPIEFEVRSNIPIDHPISVLVDYGAPGDTAVGAVFADVFISGNSDIEFLEFGTDYDSGQDIAELPASVDAMTVPEPDSVTVLVVQDETVEGGTSDESGFGTEEFDVSLSVSTDEDEVANPALDSDEFTFEGTAGVITDDDGQLVDVEDEDEVEPSGVEAIVSVSTARTDGGDPDAGEGDVGGSIPRGDGAFVFSVSTPVQSDIVVRYSYTVNGIEGNTGGDLTEALSGEVTIPGSVTGITAPVVVPFSVFDDIIVEDNETITVTIDRVVSAGLTDSNDELVNDPNLIFDTMSATATIFDNDQATVGIRLAENSNGRTVEGATEDDSTVENELATYEIFITKQSDTSTIVELGLLLDDTITDTANGLLLGDFIIEGATVTQATDDNPLRVEIPRLTPFVTITVRGRQDSVTEGPEILNFELDKVIGDSNISIDSSNASAMAVIEDDGDGLKISISDVTTDATEPDADGLFTLAITDNNDDPAFIPVGSTVGRQGVVVLYEVVILRDEDGDRLPGQADEGADYESLGTKEVFIPEGALDNPVTITIDPREDDDAEGTETVSIRITQILNRQDRSEFMDDMLLNDEVICFDDSIATLNITPPPLDSDTHAILQEIYARGTGFDSDFNDMADDMLLNGTDLGFKITGLDRTLPFFNVNQFVLQFGSDVDLEELDIEFGGVAGAFEGLNSDERPSIIPTVASVTLAEGTTDRVIVSPQRRIGACKTHIDS